MSMNRWLWVVWVIYCAWPYAFPAMSWAQIRTDGSLGNAVNLSGHDVVIPAGVGQIRGTNLFHSFGAFNVPTGGSATFQGPTKIENIVGRVTGGAASIIDGTLRSEIPAANLFLLNPQGIVIGANARLEVGGSFYMSTADELHFEDGAVFQAKDEKGSVLSSAAPRAFGFLGGPVGNIHIKGSQLTVAREQTLGIVGGDITIEDSQLRAPSGTLALTSVADGTVAAEVPLQPTHAIAAGRPLGEVAITGATLETDGNGGGLVAIRSSRLTVAQALISADNDGNTPRAGTSIDIAVTDTFGLRDGAALRVNSRAAGRGGDLRIAARVLELTGESAILTQSQGRSTGGRIDIRAERVQLAERALIGTEARNNGQGGDVSIVADAVSLSTNAQIVSNTLRNRGGAGSIHITAKNSLRIKDVYGGQTGIFAQGGAASEIGEIRIEGGALVMNGGVIGTPASEQTDSRARAGNISVSVDLLRLTGGASIDSRTLGGAAGGDIIIQATEAELSERSTITAGTRGGGDAGMIRIDVLRLTLADGAQITSSTEGGSGSGGDIVIEARAAIVITGENSSIRSSASGAGEGGEIRLQAQAVTLSDRAVIAADSSGTGRAGKVSIEAQDLSLQQQSLVTTEAAQASGGAVTIAADRLELQDSQVTAAVQGEAGTFGGDINIDVTGSAILHNSLVSASANEGQGGNINIAATDALILQSSTISASANVGQGGNIDIETGVFLMDGLSHITATAGPAGIDGVVGIRAVTTDVQGTVAPLSQPFAAASSLSDLHCAQRLRGGQISSFVVAGRAGLPVDPSGGLPSFLVELPLGPDHIGRSPELLPDAVHAGEPAAADWYPCPKERTRVAQRQQTIDDNRVTSGRFRAER
ncbi:two-partner secretion domain-containing protein [Candidatus Entotheonella palauensis]|uniref:two-partner secretion domain-containing protein n=1 Tax=Candidatus Entotheonella palauensis TaxID=93172 RepID=UPI000B7C89D9|nr:filamentous hemagglutinin N-terminal domain-containing protein [Candidatus Entotheonella palauensis]